MPLNRGTGFKHPRLVCGDVAVVRRIGQAREAAATKTSLGHNHLFLILTDSEGV